MEKTALESWLQKATRCLAAQSAAQARREIQEHYELARETALNNGSTPEEAERTAVVSFGDPRKANRAYRKVLLTANEARMLGEAQREYKAVCARPWLVWALRAMPVVALCMAVVFYAYDQGFPARLLFFIGVGSGVFLAAPTLRLYTPSRARIFRYAKWAAIIPATGLAFGPAASDWFGALAICFTVIVWIEWTRHSIRRKLPVAQWPRSLYL